MEESRREGVTYLYDFYVMNTIPGCSEAMAILYQGFI